MCREVLNQNLAPVKANPGHVPNPDTQRGNDYAVADGGW